VPGSQQDFVVNVGDRVFESDQTELSPQAIATPTSRRSGCSSTTLPPRSKATPTSAAPASTTLRSAPSAPSRFAASLLRAASIRRGCGPSLRQGAPGGGVTTSRAGRRIAAR
jgi:hypothetical protein